MYYSGKKKRHTLKTQVVVNKANRQIICTDFANGSKHDFAVFKESKVRMRPETKLSVDTGFIGIKNIHANSELPIKSSKLRPLTHEDKAYNRTVSGERVLVENVIGFLKRFKILADRYRNRRKRFGLRFNLIAGICNFDLSI